MADLEKKIKILVIRYRFLGDTILTVPFLKRLREAYPGAHIAVLIGPQSGNLLLNCPYIDELINFDTTRFHKYDSGQGKSKSFWEYVWQLRKENFDIAYVLKRSLSSAFLVWLAGISQRIGFDTEFRGFFLTKKIKFDSNQSEVLNFLAHLDSPFNMAPPISDRLFWPTVEEKQKANTLNEKYLSSSKKRILIHAPAAHPLKMWSIDGWAELISKLKKLGYEIVFSGANVDQAYYEEIENKANLKADLNLCLLENTLRENIAVYEKCDLAICVDSGPMHLAAAVGVPLIALFGPSDPKRWHPWAEKYRIITSSSNLACRPCLMKPTCEKRECLTEIKAEQILDSIEELIDN